MKRLPTDRDGRVFAGACDLGTVHTLPFNATSAASAALTPTTRVVRLVATKACLIAIGTNPVATSTSIYLPADRPEYVAVIGGQKIAAVAAIEAEPGTLNIAEAM